MFGIDVLRRKDLGRQMGVFRVRHMVGVGCDVETLDKRLRWENFWDIYEQYLEQVLVGSCIQGAFRGICGLGKGCSVLIA